MALTDGGWQCDPARLACPYWPTGDSDPAPLAPQAADELVRETETLGLYEVASQADGELRERVAGWLFDFSMKARGVSARWSDPSIGIPSVDGDELLSDKTLRDAWRSEADALLDDCGLLADAAAVQRVEALAEKWRGWQENSRRYGAAHPEEADVALARELAYGRAIEDLRRALDGSR